MEKEFAMEFNDKRIEALRQELLEKETFRQLREMSLDQLDEVLEQCIVKTELFTEKMKMLEEMAVKIEVENRLVEDFVAKYLVPVYQEEHDIDITGEQDE